MSIKFAYEKDGSIRVTCGDDTAVIPAWWIGLSAPAQPVPPPLPPAPMPSPTPIPKIPSAPPSLPSVFVYLPNMIDYSILPSLRRTPTVLDIQRGERLRLGGYEAMMVPGWRPGVQCVDVRVLRGQSFDLGALNQYVHGTHDAPLRLWMTGETE